MNYWLHRISHESDVSNALLANGYLSIGYSDFCNLPNFTQNLNAANLDKYFMDVWGNLYRGRFSLLKFVAQMKAGDKVLVPQGNVFSVYEIESEAMSVAQLQLPDLKDAHGNAVTLNVKGLLQSEKSNTEWGLGFVRKVKVLKTNIPRHGYADEALVSRMKILSTNANISDLKESVEKVLENKAVEITETEEEKDALYFSLEELAEWQLNPDSTKTENKKKVQLPALQRGFVWKPNQIEALWDSILRGYPIGSLLLSRSGKEYFLLDGQQRSTSITLGFYNPWQEEEKNKQKFWSIKNTPVVWIDLINFKDEESLKKITTTQKFIIRVVTQSHPWGYQCKDNTKILSASDRYKALKRFEKIEGNVIDGKMLNYTKLPLTNVFPYDATLPVPLCFLIDAIEKNQENWKAELYKSCEKLPVLLTNECTDNTKYLERIKSYLDSSDDTFYKAIINLMQTKVPAIVVSEDVLKEEESPEIQDPTLFVRLNSAGTRISGEELVYSIYKAAFPDAKQLVENVGIGFIPPSQVIVLAARLINSEINGGTYTNPINVGTFRQLIKKDTFKDKLKQFIANEGDGGAKKLFELAIEIIQSTDDVKMPPVLAKNIIRSSQEVFLMLLQWLKIHKITNYQSIENKKAIIAAVTSLVWFNKDNASK